MTAAYASIADGGVYHEPIFYTKVVDEDGNVLLSNDPSQTRVMKASTSWLLTDAAGNPREGDGKQAALDDQKMAVAGKNGASKGNYDFGSRDLRHIIQLESGPVMMELPNRIIRTITRRYGKDHDPGTQS